MSHIYFDADTDKQGFSIMFTEVHPEALLGDDFLLSDSELNEVVSVCQQKEVQDYEDLCDICKECFRVDPKTKKILRKR